MFPFVYIVLFCSTSAQLKSAAAAYDFASHDTSLFRSFFLPCFFFKKHAQFFYRIPRIITPLTQSLWMAYKPGPHSPCDYMYPTDFPRCYTVMFLYKPSTPTLSHTYTPNNKDAPPRRNGKGAGINSRATS